VKSSSKPLSSKRKGPPVAAPFVTTAGNEPHHAKRSAKRLLSFGSVPGEREGQQEGEGKWRKTDHPVGDRRH